MTGGEEHVQVVVCGAGVAGLALARLLGGHGVRVLILEREPEFREAFKGEVLQPRALRVLHAIGALDAVRGSGALRAESFTACAPDGRILSELPYSGLPAPFQHMLVHGFRDLQLALAQDLPPTVELRFGSSVRELQADDDGRITGVRAGTHRISAALTVAGDGRGSRIRRAAGLDVHTERYPHEFVGFELTGITRSPARLCAYAVRDGVVLFFPLPGDRARMYVQAVPGAFRQARATDTGAWIDSVLEGLPVLQPWADRVHAAADSARILPIWRHEAPVWQRPGFALIGDAAHSVHPIAAQGMAAALDDVWTLGTLLAAANLADPASVDVALARYRDLRRARAEFTARLSHSLAVLLTGTSAAARAFRRHELRVIAGNDRLRRIMVHNMSGTGVRRFTASDRFIQLGLPDPRRRRAEALTPEPLVPEPLAPGPLVPEPLASQPTSPSR